MNTQKISPKISPIVQFIFLIVPLVMSGFFAVYSLTGLILDGRDLYNWSLEATGVALWVGGGIIVFSTLVLLYARGKGVSKSHILSISGWSHMLIAAVLTLTVIGLVKL